MLLTLLWGRAVMQAEQEAVAEESESGCLLCLGKGLSLMVPEVPLSHWPCPPCWAGRAGQRKGTLQGTCWKGKA